MTIVHEATATNPIMRKRSARPISVVSARILILAALLFVWELWLRLSGDTIVIAPPSAIVGALFTDVLPDGEIRGAILLALTEVVAAYALAISGGLVIGIAVGSTDFSRQSLYPIILLLYAIPQAVLLPLFTLGFGIGPAAKIAFGFSHGVFPVIVNVVAGMRNVSPHYLRAAQSMGASRADIFRHVTFPHMVGSFFTGLRLAMTMTLLGVILAELYVSTSGVGYFTKLFAETFDPSPLFALIGALALMAIGLNELVRVIERRFTRWKNP
jgi:NitT/TauT family transport system permease protein